MAGGRTGAGTLRNQLSDGWLDRVECWTRATWNFIALLLAALHLYRPTTHPYIR